MPGLQEWIHKFEEGEGVRLVKLIALGLAILGLTAMYDLRKFRNFTAPEAMEAAQLGRNLAHGKGYTTDCVRPLSMYLVQKHRTDGNALLKQGHPDLSNPPLYPLILAGLMKVLPFNYGISQSEQVSRYQPEFLIGLFNQAWFFFAAWLLFRLAKRLFDAPVAWLSAGIFLGSELFWRFSISGLPTMLLVVAFLGIVWCLVRLDQGARTEQRTFLWCLAWAAGAGALVGTGALMRYAFGWLIIPVVVYLATCFGQRRIALAVTALAVWGIILAPWLARNYALSGTLFGTAGYALYQDTPSFTGNTLERSLTVAPGAINGINLDDSLRKLFINVNHILQNELPKLGGSWLTAFFLVGLLLPFRNSALARLRFFLLGCLALFTIVQALGQTYLTALNPEVSSENLLVILAPLVFCYGAGIYYSLLEGMEVPFLQAKRWITGVMCLFCCSPLLFAFLPPRSHPISLPYYPWLVQHTAGFMKEQELLMSDMPWAVAWYGQRQCAMLTLNPQNDFFTINDYQKPIQGLYLTELTLDEHFLSQLVKGEDKTWGLFILQVTVTKQTPPGFPLKNAWSAIMPDQMFLADWERWSMPGK